jgi:hypothetical protein
MFPPDCRLSPGTVRMYRLTSYLAPRTKKLHPVLHIFGREVRNQFQQTAPVLTHRVLLLTGEDNSCMRFVLRHMARMELIEIRDIETAQHAPLGCGELKMVLN